MYFNWEQCQIYIRKDPNQVLGGYILSTSSFVSSTGDCAMIGMSSHDRKVFLVHNFEQIKKDISMKEGEYLTAYVSLWNCDERSSKYLNAYLVNNFLDIFGLNGEKVPKEVDIQLEKLITSKETFIKGCQVYIEYNPFKTTLHTLRI